MSKFEITDEEPTFLEFVGIIVICTLDVYGIVFLIERFL